jgi:hypothetical protein
MKNVVMLATIHQYQMSGNDASLELGECLDYLRSEFKVQKAVDFQTAMEEWSEELGETVVREFATESGLHWANVGTPDEPQFRTYAPFGAVKHPGHNGTLRWDPHAPPIDEYGPFEKQEAREKRMVQNVRAEMENYESGILVLGLAHMHSVFEKLESSGFKVYGYKYL